MGVYHSLSVSLFEGYIRRVTIGPLPFRVPFCQVDFPITCLASVCFLVGSNCTTSGKAAFYRLYLPHGRFISFFPWGRSVPISLGRVFILVIEAAYSLLPKLGYGLFFCKCGGLLSASLVLAAPPSFFQTHPCLPFH